MVKIPALLSVALLLQLPGSRTERVHLEDVHFKVKVENSLLGFAPVTFSTHTKYRGILLGGLTTLKDSNPMFKFNYTINPNFGPYLESVNGVAGNDKHHLYWNLLVKTPDEKIKEPDVGIGCYIPSENDVIILQYSKW